MRDLQCISELRFWRRSLERRGRVRAGHTIHKSVENRLSVLLHQVVDVAENATVAHVRWSFCSRVEIVVAVTERCAYHMLTCK